MTQEQRLGAAWNAGAKDVVRSIDPTLASRLSARALGPSEEEIAALMAVDPAAAMDLIDEADVEAELNELAHPVRELTDDEIADQVLANSERWLRPRH